MSLPQRKTRTTRRAAALVAAAAMVAVGAQAASSATAAPAKSAVTPAATAAPLTVAQHASLLKSADAAAPATAKALGLGAKEKLVARDVMKDRDGTVHTRYERTYDGLPVLGGDLVVHEKAGKRTVTKATNAAIRPATTTPSVAAAHAESTAVKSAKAAKVAKAAPGSARKVVWAASGKPVLAWETVVTGTQPDGTPSKLHVITDAATGKKLFERQAIENEDATAKSQYSGTVTLQSTKSGSGYALTDGTRGGHSTYDLNQGTSGKGTLFTDDDNTWGGGRQTAGVDAAYGAQQTWDFYKNVFKRNGIRDDGKGAYSRAHYGNNYVNAFWDDSCFCMTYGDGDGDSHPLTALDVGGHEMSHGVTAATAGLEYAGESGGLNEATSDIFATGVEFWSNNPADPGDYLIGEKIDINGDGTPLRYMDKPSKDGQSLDSWSSDAGNVDVHYSSGIANHFFYLLSEGSGKKTINGVDYDSPTANSVTVKGIGRDKALQVWYKALTEYMTSTTDYKAARAATLKAAGALYGETSDEYKQVGDAWTGVNVK